MKEYDIRPADIYAELLRLSQLDAEIIFDHSLAKARPCPACGEDHSKPSFVKAGFTFAECASCATLFANPLPPSGQFERFYRDGKSARYWSDVFVPRVMEARRASIVRPRVEQIRSLCKGKNLAPADIVDVGAGHGMFLEEWRALDPAMRGWAVEPNGILAERCRQLGFEVYEGIGERAGAEWRGVADLATCFEVVEHVPNLDQFVNSMFALLRPGGWALITSLGCDGFDIRVLWEKANCICPPSHINFCSREGYKRLFEMAGFKNVEVLTPGVLDVDIVRNKLAQEAAPVSRFERMLLSSSPDVLADFQKFLTKWGFSSHTWVFAQRPAS